MQAKFCPDAANFRLSVRQAQGWPERPPVHGHGQACAACRRSPASLVSRLARGRSAVPRIGLAVTSRNISASFPGGRRWVTRQEPRQRGVVAGLRGGGGKAQQCPRLRLVELTVGRHGLGGEIAQRGGRGRGRPPSVRRARRRRPGYRPPAPLRRAACRRWKPRRGRRYRGGSSHFSMPARGAGGGVQRRQRAGGVALETSCSMAASLLLNLRVGSPSKWTRRVFQHRHLQVGRIELHSSIGEAVPPRPGRPRPRAAGRRLRHGATRSSGDSGFAVSCASGLGEDFAHARLQRRLCIGHACWVSRSSASDGRHSPACCRSSATRRRSASPRLSPRHA